MDDYAQALTTSESIINTRADVVKRVARATIRGLKGAMGNPQEAGAIILRCHREVDADIATSETKILSSLAEFPGVPIGTIQAARMSKTIGLVLQTTTLAHPVPALDVFIAI